MISGVLDYVSSNWTLIVLLVSLPCVTPTTHGDLVFSVAPQLLQWRGFGVRSRLALRDIRVVQGRLLSGANQA